MPNTYDYVALYSSVGMTVGMALVVAVILVYVCLKSQYRWVQFMLVLCLIQNIDTALLAVAVYLEITDYH